MQWFTPNAWAICLHAFGRYPGFSLYNYVCFNLDELEWKEAEPRDACWKEPTDFSRVFLLGRVVFSISSLALKSLLPFSLYRVLQ